MKKSKNVREKLAFRKLGVSPQKIYSVKIWRAAVLVERPRCKKKYLSRIISETNIISDMARATAMFRVPVRDKMRKYIQAI